MAHRILAVDDNEIVGWTLAARLWVAGYEVETVCSASEAFMALRESRYDLVLLDLEMPDMGGLRALEVMREQNLCRDAPVVLLTSSEDFAHVQHAYTLGAKGYLTKAHAATALIKSIDRLMKIDDVIWLDDHHCVSRQTAPQDQPAQSFLSVVAPDHGRTPPPVFKPLGPMNHAPRKPQLYVVTSSSR